MIWKAVDRELRFSFAVFPLAVVRHPAVSLMLALCFCGAAAASDGTGREIEGDWRILADDLDQRMVIHIESDPNGALTGIASNASPEDVSPALTLEAITFEEGKLRFEVMSGQGVFEGTMQEDGLAIQGQWRQQGQDSRSLVLKRVGQEPPRADSPGAGPARQSAQEPPRSESGLVARWKFDGDANDSAGANHGTIRGNPTYVTGKSGQALNLDGDDCVDCGNASALNFDTGDWAVSAWIKTTQSGAEDENKGTVFANGADGGGGVRYALAVSEGESDKITVTTDDDLSKIQAISITAVNDGAWHHVAAVRYEARLLIYVDGTLETTSALPSQYSLAGAARHNACVGAITDSGEGSLVKYFVGQIDDVCVFACALGGGDVRRLYEGADPRAVAREAAVSPTLASGAPLPQDASGSKHVVVILILILILAGLVGGIVRFVVRSN